MNKIDVLIVDDSRTTRALIKHELQKHAHIASIREAVNPYEARDMIKLKEPDVITLDIEMPEMNGLQFLDKIMRLHPIPVVMVSSLTQKGAYIAIKALQMGAFECFPKTLHHHDTKNAFLGLGELVLEASKSKAYMNRKASKIASQNTCQWRQNFSLIAIGASTGGVEAIEDVIKHFPKDSPPVVICQHMPALYTKHFADRLNKSIPQLSIEEAKDREILQNGYVRIAPGGDFHLSVEQRFDGHIRTRLKEGPLIGNHRPSVNYLFESVAALKPSNVLSILLTGMGSDGAQGLLKIKQAGGMTITQDEKTSIVYGMPRVAHELGADIYQLPLDRIAFSVMNLRHKNHTIGDK